MSASPPRAEFRLGEGRISGVLSVVLGALGLGAVLCFLFPEWLTTADLRAVYPLVWVRFALHTAILCAAGFGLMSVLLAERRRLGGTGIALALVATLLGGAGIEVQGDVEQRPGLGLDWFVLDLLLLALVFVPLERAFARLREQHVFRPGWRTDLAHFAVSHLAVQFTALAIVAPATVLLGWSVRPAFQQAVASQPLALQFVEAMLLADLFQYGAHRLFHRVPFLWRFHAVHHSSTQMDWLAGSRLHLVDAVATRAISFAPLFWIGFAPEALAAYLVFVSFQAVFIHANVWLRFGPLRWLIATPEYHHWHHAAEPQAVDKNFAVHLPAIDVLFGTAYQPKRWPNAYGIEGDPVPQSWWRQLVGPFRGSWADLRS